MTSMMKLLRGSASVWALALGASAALAATAVQADVTISSAATKNMTCSGGVCSPTKNTAVLNVSDLETMLASGNATVTTTGTGSIQAGVIDITAPLTWSTSSVLTLDANPPDATDLEAAINISAPVSVTGTGGLTINRPAAPWNFAFTDGANITFANLTSSLVINGNTYVLVETVAELAAAWSNGDTNIAFAQNYDASGDGTYSGPPVLGVDNFEGLGNSISNLTISDPSAEDPYDGLFKSVNGYAADFGVSNVSITNQPSEGGGVAGAIGAVAGGTLWRCWATGTLNVENTAGGLIGQGGTAVLQSWSDVSITVDGGSYAGGIMGQSSGGDSIEQSFALGPVTATSDDASIGGLVGEKNTAGSGTISESYSTGAVTLNIATNNSSQVGGMIGTVYGGEGYTEADQTYSAGAVSAPASSCGTSYNCVGGWVGADLNSALYKDNDWDTTTSGQSQGVGNIPSDKGIKGLSNNQLTSKLPKGFSNKVWAQSSSINNGLPYLIANPPPQ